jgi:hypothetical protein
MGYNPTVDYERLRTLKSKRFASKHAASDQSSILHPAARAKAQMWMTPRISARMGMSFQPAAGKSRPPQARDQIRTLPHQRPWEIGAMVLDHQHNRPLVDGAQQDGAGLGQLNGASG